MKRKDFTKVYIAMGVISISVAIFALLTAVKDMKESIGKCPTETSIQRLK